MQSKMLLRPRAGLEEEEQEREGGRGVGGGEEKEVRMCRDGKEDGCRGRRRREEEGGETSSDLILPLSLREVEQHPRSAPPASSCCVPDAPR